MEGNYLLNYQRHEKTVKPPVSDHQKCNVQGKSSPGRFTLAWKSALGTRLIYRRWSVTRIEPQESLPSQKSRLIYFIVHHFLYSHMCSSLLSINVCEQHCTNIENRYQTIHLVIAYKRLKTQLKIVKMSSP